MKQGKFEKKFVATFFKSELYKRLVGSIDPDYYAIIIQDKQNKEKFITILRSVDNNYNLLFGLDIERFKYSIQKSYAISSFLNTSMHYRQRNQITPDKNAESDIKNKSDLFKLIASFTDTGYKEFCDSAEYRNNMQKIIANNLFNESELKKLCEDHTKEYIKLIADNMYEVAIMLKNGSKIGDVIKLLHCSSSELKKITIRFGKLKKLKDAADETKHKKELYKEYFDKQNTQSDAGLCLLSKDLEKEIFGAFKNITQLKSTVNGTVFGGQEVYAGNLSLFNDICKYGLHEDANSALNPAGDLNYYNKPIADSYLEG